MNTFGRVFRCSILGESHGHCVGIVIDGCPAGVAIIPEDFEEDLERRRPSHRGTTLRQEPDKILIESGIFKGTTTGAPLLIRFENRDVDSSAYEKIKNTPRPGHADFVALKKFGGFQDYRGGGHFSGRLTTALVAAGVVAKKILQPVILEAKLIEAGGSQNIEVAVDKALAQRDSIGGIVECRVQGLPIGLGEPFFDSVESLISHVIFSIPAIKGIEFGSGFATARMRGSESNDEIEDPSGTTKTNHAGGINGGLTNGNELVFRVAVKPTSSIKQVQQTVDLKSGQTTSI